MKTPWRYWLTGGIAAVLAAASQAQSTGGEQRVARASRYSLEETVDRIAQEARRHGLPVLARLAPPRSLQRALDAPCWLLVLGSDTAHTPVLQTDRDAPLALPLTLRVVAADAGGATVGYTDPGWLADHDGLPREVLDRAASLPALLDAALAASRGPANA